MLNEMPIQASTPYRLTVNWGIKGSPSRRKKRKSCPEPATSIRQSGPALPSSMTTSRSRTQSQKPDI